MILEWKRLVSVHCIDGVELMKTLVKEETQSVNTAHKRRVDLFL